MEEKADPTAGPVPLEANGLPLAKVKSAPETNQETSRTNQVQPSGQGEEPPEYVTGFKLAIINACITLVVFLLMLDQSIIATAIPRITTDFHSLPDITFLSFLGLFELGSLLCGVANSSKMLIVGRAVAGLGSSGLVNGALTILAACVPLAKRPVYLGFIMSVSQLGIVLGPLVGGILTEYTTWRWCFYINLPIGGVTAGILLFISIPDQTVKTSDVSLAEIVRQKLDLLGFAIFAPAAIQFFLALEWGGTRYPWSSATVIGLLCGGAATFVVFLAWEYRKGDTAMIPFSMMRRKVIWSSCIVQLFFFGGVIAMSYYLPIYFQAVKGASPTMSGVDLLPSILLQVLLSLICGVLVGKLGYYLPWIIVSTSLSSVGYGLLSTLTPTSSTGLWVGYQIIIGAARGCGFQIPIIAVQNNIPPSSLSVAMAVLVFSQTFGGSVILAVSQTAFTNSLKSAIQEFAPEVDVTTLLAGGASAVRKLVPPESLHGVLLAYNQALNTVFYLAAGVGVASFAFCWGMGWKNVKKEKKTEKSDPEA